MAIGNLTEWRFAKGWKRPISGPTASVAQAPHCLHDLFRVTVTLCDSFENFKLFGTLRSKGGLLPNQAMSASQETQKWDQSVRGVRFEGNGEIRTPERWMLQIDATRNHPPKTACFSNTSATTMFTTPKKAFIKLRAHPYLSPLKLFGFAEPPTVTPVSSPGGHSIPPPSPIYSRLSTPPTPRKRYGAYHETSPLKPLRPVGRGYHRVGMRRTTSRQSLHRRCSIRNLRKARAARDFVGLTRAAFNTANGSRSPLTHEDRIFLQELANLGATREITTSLAEARAAADRAAELASLINAERESKAQASLAREKERQDAFATQKEAQVAAEAAAERKRLEKVKLQADELFMRQQRQFELHKQQAESAANHARAQYSSRGFNGIDVSMKDASMCTEMDASMYIDMDVSMRTAAPYSPPPSPSPPPPPPLTDADRFVLYERKWAALKSDVPVLFFELLPWPTLHDASTPEDITEERMAEFFYNPERPGYENKTQKERARIELLRWHPDKFLGKVLGKVDAGHRAMVEEAMGQVTRFLVASSSS